MTMMSSVNPVRIEQMAVYACANARRLMGELVPLHSYLVEFPASTDLVPLDQREGLIRQIKRKIDQHAVGTEWRGYVFIYYRELPNGRANFRIAMINQYLDQPTHRHLLAMLNSACDFYPNYNSGNT